MTQKKKKNQYSDTSLRGEQRPCRPDGCAEMSGHQPRKELVGTDKAELIELFVTTAKLDVFITTVV